ncbi:MAG TPA: hypothetical protein VFS43_39615 [Polyangiaceae bacterium]|nr:hypothetical protein [Polyangiaceae bacterium]
MPPLRAPLALLVGILAGCAYDWSLPEGQGGSGTAGEGGQGGVVTGVCFGDIDACVRAVCGDEIPRKCAPDLCEGLTSAECSALVCGDGLGAIACVTQLCIRHAYFCRDYTDERLRAAGAGRRFSGGGVAARLPYRSNGR